MEKRGDSKGQILLEKDLLKKVWILRLANPWAK